jgi:hypothetical protein
MDISSGSEIGKLWNERPSVRNVDLLIRIDRQSNSNVNWLIRGSSANLTVPRKWTRKYRSDVRISEPLWKMFWPIIRQSHSLRFVADSMAIFLLQGCLDVIITGRGLNAVTSDDLSSGRFRSRQVFVCLNLIKPRMNGCISTRES